jgi:NADH pyrophosphatase NudC (nudix superfamily)
MKKELSVVFVVHKNEEGNFSIMMGKQAPGKKLTGVRNGYGGKCEDGETTLGCAVRELKEELNLENNFGIVVSQNDLQKVGKVLMDEKVIDFFVLELPNKIAPPSDNSEFVDTKWFDLENPVDFVGEMLSGDEEVIGGLKRYLESGVTFEIKKTGNQELEKQTKNIFN